MNYSLTTRDLNVSRDNLRRWLKQEDLVKKSVLLSREENTKIKRRMRSSNPMYCELENELLKYIREKRSNDLNVIRKAIQREAMRIFPVLYPNSSVVFKAPSQFVRRFMKRNGLTRRVVMHNGQRVPANVVEICHKFLANIVVKAALRLHLAKRVL